MMSAKLKWLIVIQLLLNELALCRVPPPLASKNTLLAGAGVHGEAETNEGRHSPLGSQIQSGLPFIEKPDLISVAAQTQETSANHVISKLKAKLHRQIQDRLYIQGNVTCEELLSASTVADPSSSAFPRELLGLSLVPVLVVAGCPQEAQTLVVKLYDLLGVEDTEELLMEMEALMEQRMSRSVSPPPAAASAAASLSERDQTWHQIDAVMFNIQQIAKAEEEDSSEDKWRCEGWTRVNGTTLVGTAVEGATGDLEEAVNACERLGVQCAGVTNSGTIKPGKYQVILKRGSRILPSESSGNECWIHQCLAEDDVWTPAASGGRMKRSPQRTCINKSEQRVYNVMEWIPAVSTLYNLGTAVYYASVNCSETAKERALLSAVDLSTDALMVATGGTAGVAGYALGAGVKTGVKAGVKYLLNYMKEDDDMQVNQVSWEEGVFTVQ